MTERKTVYRWFWDWEFEKEEQWLNQMAQSGWLLDRVGFCAYHLIACEPGAYAVRLEMHRCDADYVAFMEETGAEYIGRVAQWVYFRKKTADGPFDLFSDYDSKLSHLDRVGRMLAAVGFANLVIGLVNSFHPVVNAGWINLLLSTLLMYGLGRIHGKKETLEKARLLQES